MPSQVVGGPVASATVAGLHLDGMIAVSQTEQECGCGRNDWRHCRYAWAVMKHYLSSTVVVIKSDLAEPLPVGVRIGDRPSLRRCRPTRSAPSS